MEKPLPTYLQSLVLSAGIALGASGVQAQSSNYTNSQVGNILSGFCIPEVDDISTLSQRYTIESGDTFSGIAASMGINYGDFILYLREFNPGIDINEVIKVGESFSILSDDVTQSEIDRYKYALEQRQQYDDVVSLYENGNFEELNEIIDFSIFPRNQIGIGPNALMAVYGRLFESDPMARGARMVDVIEENLTICANLSKATTLASINLGVRNNRGVIVGEGDTGVLGSLPSVLLRNKLHAWMKADVLIEAGYTNIPEFSGRENGYFNDFMAQLVNPIKPSRYGEYRDEYIPNMFRYFQEQGIPDTKIPVFFLHTESSSDINLHRNARNPASHELSYIGEYTQEPYDADYYHNIEDLQPYARKEFTEGMNLGDYLVDVIQIRSALRFPNTARYSSIIRENFVRYGEFIDIYVDGEKIDLQSNPSVLDSMPIYSNSQIQLGGSVVFDGLHIYNSTDFDLNSKMNTRIMLLFEFFAIEGYFPSEVLVPPQNLQDYGYEGPYGDIQEQVEIIDARFLREGENPNQVLYNMISRKFFNVEDYRTLDGEGLTFVQQEFSRQIMANQLYGRMNHNASEWTTGATRTNGLFYLYDTTNIFKLYADYIERRKLEYYELISTICDNHEAYPFFYVKYFPGDTTTTIWSTLNRYVNSHSPELAIAMNEMLPTQRLPLIEEIFGSDIVAGNIAVGGYLLLDSESVLDLITKATGEEYIGEDYISQLSNADRELLSAISNNNQVSQAMAYYLIKEGYVPNTWYQLEDVSIGDILENFRSRFKRKDLKRYYSWLSENGYLESNQNFIAWIDISLTDGSIGDGFPAEIMIEIRSLLEKIPVSGPNSHGDMQQRPTNLLNSEYAFERWPSSNDLAESLRLILNPNEELLNILEEYKRAFPGDYAHDILILDEIMSELDLESPDGEKVYLLLTSLMRLNDTTNRHLIGKIISISLSQSLHRENITHICEQLGRVGESCSNLSAQELDSVYAYGMLTMNKGPNVALSIVTENYILRIFEAINKSYPDIAIPNVEIRQETGITTKPVLNYFELRERIEGYIAHYQSYAQDNPDVPRLIQALQVFLESEQERSQKHYTILANTQLQNILQRAGIDDFIYPSHEEININSRINTNLQIARSNFFAYINNSKIDGFISEPQQKPTDFLALFGLFMLYGQVAGAMSVGVMGLTGKTVLGTLKIIPNAIRLRYRKYLRDIESSRENNIIREEKYGKTSDIIFDSSLSIIDSLTKTGTEEIIYLKKNLGSLITNIQQRIRKRKELIRYKKSVVLTNFPDNKYRKGEYQDGEYIISPDNGVFERKGEEGTVISNSGESVFAQRAYDAYEGKKIMIKRDGKITLQNETVKEISSNVADILVLRNPVKIAAE